MRPTWTPFTLCKRWTTQAQFLFGGESSGLTGPEGRVTSSARALRPERLLERWLRALEHAPHAA
ncbi:MAG: hypothetical protein K2W78_11410, partial [Xanthobacteraceae bacterium]|nr:hypothetical protein [Xanthobacteraceae bacterium]